MENVSYNSSIPVNFATSAVIALMQLLKGNYNNCILSRLSATLIVILDYLSRKTIVTLVVLAQPAGHRLI
jgi:Cft2 family RNA processing exonuclease